MHLDGPAAALRLETKFMAFANRDAAADGRIEGYASLFDVVDQGGDAVAPGAFAKSLARAERSVKLLWQHDPLQPIGVWETLVEDARGLLAKGRLLTGVQRGAEAAALLAAGAVDGLSIGYRVVRAEKAPNGGRRLIEIDLWEVSLVTFPMLGEARATNGAEAPTPAEDPARDLAETIRAARRLLR
jgi:HK97 family phage prohead protease